MGVDVSDWVFDYRAGVGEGPVISDTYVSDFYEFSGANFDRWIDCPKNVVRRVYSKGLVRW